jgi:DNA-binding SARP family transcriptional activator
VAARFEFCLLGPLLVRAGGAVVPVPAGKQRAVLATLLLNAGQAVPVDEIAEALWGPAPPQSARVSVQNHVMRLRRALGEVGRDRIATQPRGYLIRVNPGELDLARLEALLTAAWAAAQNGSWDQAAMHASGALALWRGEPLADVDSQVLAAREVPRLAELRLQALEVRIDADLHLGRHAEVIAELRQQAGRHPLRERLYGLLMLALYRDGRQAEALAAYQDARQVLVEELGIDPGAGLRQLHHQMLTADPALELPEPQRPTADGLEPAVPRQLPTAARHFTGRTVELAALTGLLDQPGGQMPGTVVISAIGGTAGVGKTALALHWAHQVAYLFPDGQLYVNLSGFGPSGTPTAPAEVVRDFLDALGVPPEGIPHSPDAQASLYRSMLSGKRMLIVLDNARDSDQVRPLLPGNPGCLVVVTSRSQLTGLIATEGARLIPLDLLTEEDAREVLTRRVGTGRIAAEPEATAELIRLCARLPLTLSVVAARAVIQPKLALSVLAEEVREAGNRLDALNAGDTATNLRKVFSWSYLQLSDNAQRMFRLLGPQSGPDISVAAAASLAGVAARQARVALNELAAAHLITWNPDGRCTLHDLLRLYAAEQARMVDGGDDHRRATHRLLDHYLHTAHAASSLLNPSRASLAFAGPVPGVTPGCFHGASQAMAWFEAEHRVLLAVIATAADAGFASHAWQLPCTMGTYFNRRGYWHEWRSALYAALAAAERQGDTLGQARTCDDLGGAEARLRLYHDARIHLGQAIRLYRQLGDRDHAAHAHWRLAWIAEQQTHYGQALSHARKALVLSTTAGNLGGQANALNMIGWLLAQMGDYQQALVFCRRALDLHREAGDRDGLAAVWDTTGYAYSNLGQHAQAISCYRHAVEQYRDVGDRYYEADTLIHLGDTHLAIGEPQAARAAWEQALAILAHQSHPDADQMTARLLARLRDPGARIRLAFPTDAPYGRRERTVTAGCSWPEGTRSGLMRSCTVRLRTWTLLPGTRPRCRRSPRMSSVRSSAQAMACGLSKRPVSGMHAWYCSFPVPVRNWRWISSRRRWSPGG